MNALLAANERKCLDLGLGFDENGPIEAYHWVYVDPITRLDITEVRGTIVAYAIDASTLGTTNRRVGTLEIPFHTLATKGNIFESRCSLEDAGGMPCLNDIVQATYTPLPVGGEGVYTTPVPGFVWWTPASSPYNYGR